MYRCPQNNAWFFSLDYNASADPPNEDSIWTTEESYATSAHNFDGSGCGFNFNNSNGEGVVHSVLFWVDKDSLSQGYDLLEADNTTQMFSETHDNGNAQNKQVDRAPDDTGDPDPTYPYTCVPEFPQAIIPISGAIALFVALRRRRLKARPNQQP